MQKGIHALVLVLAFFIGALEAMAARTPPADVGAGRIAWFDITTTKIALSTEFYLSDGIGAIALVIDPAGHAIGMYSRAPLPK